MSEGEIVNRSTLQKWKLDVFRKQNFDPSERLTKETFVKWCMGSLDDNSDSDFSHNVWKLGQAYSTIESCDEILDRYLSLPRLMQDSIPMLIEMRFSSAQTIAITNAIYEFNRIYPTFPLEEIFVYKSLLTKDKKYNPPTLSQDFVDMIFSFQDIVVRPCSDTREIRKSHILNVFTLLRLTYGEDRVIRAMDICLKQPSALRKFEEFFSVLDKLDEIESMEYPLDWCLQMISSDVCKKLKADSKMHISK